MWKVCMSNTWKDFMLFINNHPVGVALKIFVATALTWLIDNIADFGLPMWVVVAAPPAIVVLIDYLNGENTRFGRVSADG
jgi:hypothetical protein